MISCFSGDETMCAAASLHSRCIQMLFLNAVAWKFGIQSNISFEGGKEGENKAKWIHPHVCASRFRRVTIVTALCAVYKRALRSIHDWIGCAAPPCLMLTLIIGFTMQSNFCGEKYSDYTVTQISAIPERKRLKNV